MPKKQTSYFFTSDSFCLIASQILTALRGTVKITGPRWCQNHDYAQSKAEGIVIILNLAPIFVSSQYLFYIPNERNKIVSYLSFKVLLLLTKFVPHDYLKIQMAHRGTRACDFHVITAQKYWRMRRCDFDVRNTTCPGHSNFSGQDQTMPTLLTNKITGIFGWDI